MKKFPYSFLFLVSGLALMFTGRVWVADGFEIPVVVSGTLVLTSGHLLNRRLCRLCVACEHQEQQKSIVPHDSFLH